MKMNKVGKKLLDSIQKLMKREKCNIITDAEIAKCYENSSMYYFYKRSMRNLKLYVDSHNREMPTASIWNSMAKENGYLSSESLKYMGHIEFPEE